MSKLRLLSSATLKRFISVHSWLGIVTGMALFIAFYAGALTMYESAIYQWTNPAVRVASQHLAGADAWVAKLAAEPATGGDFTLAVKAGEPLTASYFEMSETAYRIHVGVVDDEGDWVWLPEPSQLDRFINTLHFSLGLPVMPGSLLMGIVSLVYFLALATGILIHLPQLAGHLYSLRLGKNLKRLWLDAHNLIGVLSLPFHVMFAFTGFLICLMFVMPDVFARLTPASVAVEAYRAQSVSERHNGAAGRMDDVMDGPVVPVALLLAQAKAMIPGLEPERIEYSGYGGASPTARVEGRVPGGLIGTATVALSLRDGKVIEAETAKTRTTVQALEGGYLHLHYGDFGGELLRTLYFLLGLAGAFLFYSGNLLWVESRRRQRHAEQPRSAWRMAQLTLGVCLGCCAGIAVALLANRVLPVSVASRSVWEPHSYYVVFFAAVLWAFARPPGRASYELLLANAALYLALPIFDGLYILAHGAAGWVPLNLIFACLGALFLKLGLSARHRAYHGQPNSVWALQSYIVATPAERPLHTWRLRFYGGGIALLSVALFVYLFAEAFIGASPWVDRLLQTAVLLGLTLLLVPALTEAITTKAQRK